MASAPTPVTLRPLLPADVTSLASIYVSSIEDLTGDDYSPGQQAAWSASADDLQAFGARLSGALTLVAAIHGAPVGFASLKNNDLVDMLFVHPDAVGLRVAATLCDALERLAIARRVAKLTVHASDTAQGFFAKRGYEAQRRETVPIGDEWLGRTFMSKTLAGAAPTQAG